MGTIGLYQSPEVGECGVDEAGRGCLAGPVVAAAVILPPDIQLLGLADSKSISEKKRLGLAPQIQEQALAWAVAWASPAEIDEINILNASFLAMHRAIAQLQYPPELLLIDGNRFKPYPAIPHRCEVKGDARFLSIAAASILAKTARDAMMQELHEQYPQYLWAQNKGYPSKAHRAAIAQYGACPLHRQSFRLLPDAPKS